MERNWDKYRLGWINGDEIKANCSLSHTRAVTSFIVDIFYLYGYDLPASDDNGENR